VPSLRLSEEDLLRQSRLPSSPALILHSLARRGPLHVSLWTGSCGTGGATGPPVLSVSGNSSFCQGHSWQRHTQPQLSWFSISPPSLSFFGLMSFSFFFFKPESWREPAGEEFYSSGPEATQQKPSEADGEKGSCLCTTLAALKPQHVLAQSTTSKTNPPKKSHLAAVDRALAALQLMAGAIKLWRLRPSLKPLKSNQSVQFGGSFAEVQLSACWTITDRDHNHKNYCSRGHSLQVKLERALGREHTFAYHKIGH